MKSFATLCIEDPRPLEGVRSTNLPIYATSSFYFDDVAQSQLAFTGKSPQPFYSRYSNPTVEAVSDKIARLEGFCTDLEPWAVLTSSGMSAISTLVLGVLKAGDTIITQGNIYGGTTELFEKVVRPLGVEVVYVDFQNMDQVGQKISEVNGSKLVFAETPSNPALDCIDLGALCKLSHGMGAKVVVDNTFCTPYLQRPFAFGVDFIIHSTTKFLHGHGSSTAGAIVGADLDIRKRVWESMKLLGTNCSPFEAWMINMGLKTLTIRMDKHCANAMEIAKRLENHHNVLKVNYNSLASHPYHELAKKQMSQFGAMVSFEVKGGLEKASNFMNQLQHCMLAPTLGDTHTLVLHPSGMSHINVDKAIREANGITDGLVRLSVGIEDVEDIWMDLERALGN